MIEFEVKGRTTDAIFMIDYIDDSTPRTNEICENVFNVISLEKTFIFFDGTIKGSRKSGDLCPRMTKELAVNIRGVNISMASIFAIISFKFIQ